MSEFTNTFIEKLLKSEDFWKKLSLALLLTAICCLLAGYYLGRTHQLSIYQAVIEKIPDINACFV